MKPLSFFHQPYPYHHHSRELYKIASLAFLIIFLFLWLFEPFHVNPEEQRISYWLICLIHSVIPSLIYVLYFLLINLITPLTTREHWTVGKEIVYIAILFFLNGIESFLVRDIIYTNPDNWSWRYFTEEIKNTFLAGTLIASLIILIDFYRLNRSAQKQAAVANQHLTHAEPSIPEEVFIKAQVKSDDFTLIINHFLFARAEGNYAEVFYTSDKGVKKELKRISLTNLESQLSTYPHLFRCHRAYLVNTRHIFEVTGNAQGYQLSFAGTPELAYVSRKNLAPFNILLK